MPNQLKAVLGAATVQEKKMKIWSTDPAQSALIQSGSFVLEKGSYLITVTYSSAKGKNTAELYSSGTADESNQRGIILASGEMDNRQKNSLFL